MHCATNVRQLLDMLDNKRCQRQTILFVCVWICHEQRCTKLFPAAQEVACHILYVFDKAAVTRRFEVTDKRRCAHKVCDTSKTACLQTSAYSRWEMLFSILCYIIIAWINTIYDFNTRYRPKTLNLHDAWSWVYRSWIIVGRSRCM